MDYPAYVYHESGHAVFAYMFDVPIKMVSVKNGRGIAIPAQSQTTAKDAVRYLYVSCAGMHIEDSFSDTKGDDGLLARAISGAQDMKDARGHALNIFQNRIDPVQRRFEADQLFLEVGIQVEELSKQDNIRHAVSDLAKQLYAQQEMTGDELTRFFETRLDREQYEQSFENFHKSLNLT